MSANSETELLFVRLNSNIYKNIFPDTVIDIEYISDLIDRTPTSAEDIVQENHGFELYDIVYLDSNGRYQKALAEDSARASVKGVVSRISSPNVFTLMDTGRIEYMSLDHDDTSILYLSDKLPGKLVHYLDIDNTVYIPVAIYTDNSIIVNIQKGSIGDVLTPYSDHEQLFESYTEHELNDIVNQIVNGVIVDEE